MSPVREQAEDRDAGFRKLVATSVRRYLPGTPVGKACPVVDLGEVCALLGTASHLALSAAPSERRRAFEIASRTAEMYAEEHPGIAAVAAHLFARLGNFPGLSVIEERAHGVDSTSLGPYLALEQAARKTENTLQVGKGSFQLTDVQVELYEALRGHSALSISAPTSAGKSFSLLVEILRQLSTPQAPQIAYVVPTRALIRQVTQALRTVLAESGYARVPIRCVPIPYTPELASHGAIYVLTQERLFSLIHSEVAPVTITSLFVDEAQGVGAAAGARGVLLQVAISEVRRRFPACRMFFAGPMIRNPEYFLTLFDADAQGSTVSTGEAPVTQNVIEVNAVASSASLARFALRMPDGSEEDLGTRTLPFALKSTPEARARFALALPQTAGCTILYANAPADAERLAMKLAALRTPHVKTWDKDTAEFADFVRTYVHPDYSLAECLKYRVGYHYGSMPAVVREGIEELVQRSSLDFICCTSTLLQGVNLPARDLILDKPQKGKGSPMLRMDFLNLAGRAGRLTRELHGNVWCLNAASWKAAPGETAPCLSGATTHVVRAALEQVLDDGGTLVSRLVDGEDLGRREDLAAAALGAIYSDYILVGRSLATSPATTAGNRQALLELEKQVIRSTQVELPAAILKRNCAVVPSRLQELLEFLRAKQALGEWYPVVPHSRETYSQLQRVFRVLERYVSHASGESYKYDTWLATQWITNVSLREIVEKKIDHDRKNGSLTKPSSAVRRVMEDIEARIRFRYVRNMRAYCDVLSYAVAERPDAQGSPPPKHFYLFLECGASDPIVLNLISLGFSRTTALVLKKALPLEAAASPEACTELLGNLDAGSLGLPWICLRELKLLVPSANSG